MNDTVLDERICAALGAAKPTPAAEGAMEAAFVTINREAGRTSASRKQRPAALYYPSPFGNFSSWARVAAVACAVCLGVGGTAYAADQLGLINIQWPGTHSAAVSIDAPAANTEATEVPAYRLAVTAPDLPFDATEAEDTWFKAYTSGGDEEVCRYVSAETLFLDEPFSLTENFVTDAETVDVNGRTGALLTRQAPAGEPDAYTLYLPFPDEQRVVVLWAQGISRAELDACADSVSLEPTGATVSTDDLWTWSAFANQYNSAEVGESVPVTLSDEAMGTLHAVGDTFSLGDNSSLSATVASVQVYDNLSPLTNNDNIPASWKKLVRADGTLGADTISFIKEGDGTSALDSVVGTQESDMALVYATVQYTNTGDAPIADEVYFGSLLSVVHEGNLWRAYNRAEGYPGADTAQNSAWNVGCGEMAYYDTTAEGSSNPDEPNHLCNLAPGQRAEVHLAWLVNRDELDKLVLSLDPAGGSYQLDPESAAIGYVNIRQS